MGYIIVLSTASRGALLAIVASGIFLLIRASSTQRIAIALALPTLGAMALFVLPESTRSRLVNFSGGEKNEASESADARSYLLKQSILYSVQRPLFGVGPGNFSVYEGNQSREQGRRGAWHNAHNSYTQVSAENGIPAIVFYLAAILGAYRMLARTNKLARARGPGGEEIARVTLWMLVSFVGFLTAITFLNFYQTFYIPALVGIAVAVSRAATAELSRQVAPIASHRPIPGTGSMERTRPPFLRSRGGTSAGDPAFRRER
jgi:O-antigen ligase